MESRYSNCINNGVNPLPYEVSPLWKILAWAGYLVERIWTNSLYFKVVDPNKVLEQVIWKRPVIFVLWHNRLAISMALYRRFVKAKDRARTLAALVSASRDGAKLAAFLKYFGVEVARGSSSRRGAQALLELSSYGKAGYDLAITPDGPRGPRYKLQEGLITIAQLTQMPIITVGVQYTQKWELNSWDRFQVPKPFSEVVVQFGSTRIIPPEISLKRREQIRVEIEHEMIQINRD